MKIFAVADIHGKAGRMTWIEKVVKEHAVDLLIVAGDCFGMDGYLRLGIGSEKEYLIKGLDLLAEMLEELVNI